MARLPPGASNYLRRRRDERERVVVLLVAVCLLTTTISVFSHEISYLKIVELGEIVDDNGDVDIVGIVQNTHPYLSVEGVQIVLTLKKDGIVVAAIDGGLVRQLFY